jgi:hypothetical protein
MKAATLIAPTALAAMLLIVAAPRSVAAAGGLPALDACALGKPHIRPSQIMVACGDGNFYVTRLRWSRWAAIDAWARGSGHLNDCKPYCAAGHFHSYAVSVRLSRPELCSHQIREFTRMTVLYLGRKPPTVRRRQKYNAGRGCA